MREVSMANGKNEKREIKKKKDLIEKKFARAVRYMELSTKTGTFILLPNIRSNKQFINDDFHVPIRIDTLASAIHLLEEILLIQDDLAIMHLYLGICYYLLSDNKRAMQHFEDTVEIDDKLYPDTLTYIGLLQLFRENNPLKAEESFVKAIKANQKLIMAHIGLAYTHCYRKHYAAAFLKAREILRLDNSDKHGNYILKNTQQMLSRKDKLSISLREIGKTLGLVSENKGGP